MEEELGNPYWRALKTEQACIAIGSGLARRYPRDVIPFAGTEDDSTKAMGDLAELLEPGEAIYIVGHNNSQVATLQQVSELPGWQMIFNGDPISHSQHSARVKLLNASDAPNMVSLTDIAFPGFFRARTHELGSYYGIHANGELIAMAGERIALPGFREISAVCTHPSHTGHGYAATLIGQLLRTHSAAGLCSFLHVAASNDRAISLYERLGFAKMRPILFRQLRRLC